LVEGLEARGLRIMADEFAELTADDLPLITDIGRRSSQKSTWQPCPDDPVLEFDDIAADARHRLGADFALVQNLDEFLAAMACQEFGDVALAFEWIVLAAEIDEELPFAVHLEQARHAAQLGVDEAVSTPDGVTAFQDFA